MEKEQLGYHEKPDRYSKNGRETIDRMRDQVSDRAFAVFCMLSAMKYRDRGDDEKPGSLKKAEWYEAMARHIEEPALFPDPRSNRDSFTPYERPPITGLRRVLRGPKKKIVGLFGFVRSATRELYNIYIDYSMGDVGFCVWVISHRLKIINVFNSLRTAQIEDLIQKLAGDHKEQMAVLAACDRQIPIQGGVSFWTKEITIFQMHDRVEGGEVDPLDRLKAGR